MILNRNVHQIAYHSETYMYVGMISTLASYMGQFDVISAACSHSVNKHNKQ